MENEQFESYYDRAYEFDEQEEPEKALKAINQAIEFDRSSAEAHNFRGILLEKLGRKEEAVLAYEKAVQLEPEFKDAVENLSELQAEIGKEQRKNSRFQRAVRGAGIGACVFGISFAINEIIHYWLASLKPFAPMLLPTNLTDITTLAIPVDITPDIYDYLILFVRVFVYGIGIGFIHRKINKGSFKIGFLIGFFGSGIGELLFLFNSPFRFSWFLHSLVGIFVGLLFGLLQKNFILLLPLALAGGISFGLEPAIVEFSFSDTFWGVSVFTMAVLIGIISGSLKGVSFGWVTGWFSARDQTPAIITSD